MKGDLHWAYVIASLRLDLISLKGWVTTGNPLVAVCRKLCRVPHIGHTANIAFAVCRKGNTRQRTQHTAKPMFAVCLAIWHTANVAHTSNVPICRARARRTHGKNQSLSCATVVTHGKHEAHGNFLLKKLDSAIATFMGNLLLYVAL